MILPARALSIRQPWAWAVVHAGKTHENRAWGGWSNHQKRFRGEFAVHASAGMTRREYEDARDFMASFGIHCPLPHLLVRGAIIGTATVTDWVTSSHSPWFMGPGALVLENARAIEPVPCGGALGWFEPRPAPGLEMARPAKWMLPAHLQERIAPVEAQSVMAFETVEGR